MVTERKKTHRPDKQKVSFDKNVEHDQESCSSDSHCENCKSKSQRPELARKPMYKLGSWKGAFSGTQDF